MSNSDRSTCEMSILNALASDESEMHQMSSKHKLNERRKKKIKMKKEKKMWYKVFYECKKIYFF